jgi:glycosyltransferase involved in cell wall biosynthesis
MIADNRIPLITVAMPVYNGGPLLRVAVMSIVKQTLADWELLIIDDGSTDGSLAFIDDIGDDRIRVLRDGVNKGLAARLNEAIDLARGRYFARMDQDDISYPERFERQVAALEADSSLDLVGVRCVAISHDNQIIGYFPFNEDHRDLCAKPWRGIYLAHPTWMGRIAWFRRHRYATPGPYLSEDTELLLRSFRTSRFGVVPEILFAYRIRDEIAWRKLLKTRWTVLNLQIRYFTRERQFAFGVLALLMFFARAIMDLSNVILQAGSVPIFLHYRGGVDPATASKWRDVLENTCAFS